MQKPKRQSNTFPFFSDGLARSRTAQEKVAALEQQVLMLTEELKSQKVSPSPFLGTPLCPSLLNLADNSMQCINPSQHSLSVVFRGQLRGQRCLTINYSETAVTQTR